MKLKMMIGAVTLTALASVGIYFAGANAQTSNYPNIEIGPEFNAQGDLVQPKGFRQWVFIGSPLTPHGLNAGNAGFPEYHNVHEKG